MSITIVGLGPGDGRLLTREAWQILSSVEQVVYVRTQRHPAVDDLPTAVQIHSFDHLYETAASFEAVYEQIVATLIEQGKMSDVIYAVPGHPFIGESTVTQLTVAAATADIAIDIVPGLSFVEPTLTALQLDGLDGLQLFDALEIVDYHHPPFNVDVPLLLGQVYNKLLASELKLTLTAVYADEHLVTLVHGAGTVTEVVETVPLYAIDRSPHLAHLTSLYVPPLPYKADLTSFAETVAILRSPEGCPWDQEQTPQSMRSGFLEEVYEVLAALDADDTDNLREELGDVIYHIVMQAQMASEEGMFTLADVVAGIEAKIRRRHPHVWGDWQASDSDEVIVNWEVIKAKEKGKKAADSILDNVPEALPALTQSQKIQDRVRKVGFDWPTIEGVYGKLDEEIAELKVANTDAERQMEIGDLLFVVVNLAKWLDLDAETALREANHRFGRRFRQSEQLARAQGLTMAQLDLDALELLWQEAKKIVG